MQFEIELNKRIRSLNEELLANKDVEAPSKEEQYLNDIKQVQKVYQLEAHQELLAAVKLP